MERIGSSASIQLPRLFRQTCRRLGVRPTRYLLLVDIPAQRMFLAHVPGRSPTSECAVHKAFRISTSRFGIGQKRNSNCTPLGMHRIAQKVGGGWPVGAVFKSRELAGFAWQGWKDAAITHRILWLEGLQPGFNRGGNVDTFERYIYIHGTGDEPTIGRPASHGCIHVSGADLLPLYDRLPTGTLVWISAERLRLNRPAPLSR
jgi:hypothetical protein